MSRRAKVWAIQTRQRLIKELGSECVECGEREYEELTFDHIHGKDWSARGKSTDQRMCRYLKEYRIPPAWCDACQKVHGILQLLCNSCNSQKGAQMKMDDEEEERFSIVVADSGLISEAKITETCPF